LAIGVPPDGEAVGRVPRSVAEPEWQPRRPDVLQPDEADAGDGVSVHEQRPERPRDEARGDGRVDPVVHQQPPINGAANRW
jgi:hypothetical protein